MGNLLERRPRWGRPSTDKTLQHVRWMTLAPIASTFDQIVDLWAIRRMNRAKKAAENRFRDLLDRW
jgi:hypothetical protein